MRCGAWRSPRSRQPSWSSCESASTRRRLRFTLFVARRPSWRCTPRSVAMPLAVASHRTLGESLEAMLLGASPSRTRSSRWSSIRGSRTGGPRPRAGDRAGRAGRRRSSVGGRPRSSSSNELPGGSAIARGGARLRAAGHARERVRRPRDPDRAAVSRRSLDHGRRLRRRVVEVTWRATKIRTKAGNLVILPNNVDRTRGDQQLLRAGRADAADRRGRRGVRRARRTTCETRCWRRCAQAPRVLEDARAPEVLL